MAFVALDRNNPKTRYAIRMFDDPRVELVGNEFVCQACGHPMFVRGGTEIDNLLYLYRPIKKCSNRRQTQ